MKKKTLTTSLRVQRAIERLEEAYRHCSGGYPYYGVPQAIKYALDVLKRERREHESNG